jgi:hypothetical protein
MSFRFGLSYYLGISSELLPAQTTDSLVTDHGSVVFFRFNILIFWICSNYQEIIENCLSVHTRTIIRKNYPVVIHIKRYFNLCGIDIERVLDRELTDTAEMVGIKSVGKLTV